MMPGQPKCLLLSTMTMLPLASPNLAWLLNLNSLSALPHKDKTSQYRAKGEQTQRVKMNCPNRLHSLVHWEPSITTRRRMPPSSLTTGAAVMTQGNNEENLPPLFRLPQPHLNSGAGGSTAGDREQTAGMLFNLLLVTWCRVPVATDPGVEC